MAGKQQMIFDAAAVLTHFVQSLRYGRYARIGIRPVEPVGLAADQVENWHCDKQPAEVLRSCFHFFPVFGSHKTTVRQRFRLIAVVPGV